jgi:hypothetical protein
MAHFYTPHREGSPNNHIPSVANHMRLNAERAESNGTVAKGEAKKRSEAREDGKDGERAKSPRFEKEYKERRKEREKNLRRSFKREDLEILNLLRVPVYIFDFVRRTMLWCNSEGLEVTLPHSPSKRNNIRSSFNTPPPLHAVVECRVTGGVARS